MLRAALDLADREGLGVLTMRRLGSALGVEAMSLYKHVANKDEILDGIVELVVGEIEIPSSGDGWREEMKRRAVSARQVLKRHSWAIGLLEARMSTGPAVLRYVNAILGNLREAGFSIEDAGHAFWLLDSYVYGHVIQESSLSISSSDATNSSPGSNLDNTAREDYPYLVEIGEHAMRSEYSVDDEFDFGLELLLDSLGRIALPDE